MPAEDVLDQFRAEPLGQRARAQYHSVIDRAKDRAHVIVESLEQIKARAEAAVPSAEIDIVPTEIRDSR